MEWRKGIAQKLDTMMNQMATKEDTSVQVVKLNAETALKLGNLKDELSKAMVDSKAENTESMLRLYANQDSLTAFVTKLDIDLSNHLRPIVSRKDRQSESSKDDIEDKMSSFENKTNQQHAYQMGEIQKLVDSLSAVQYELAHCPKQKQIQAMVEMIENEFKKQLGHDVEGIQGTINKIVNAVHNKAGKGDVVRLISKSIAGVKVDIARLNGVEIPAGGYKCLSCGHSGTTVRLMTGGPSPRNDDVEDLSFSSHITHGDDVSVNSTLSMLSDPSLVAVLNRSAGLKPLGQYREPEDPKVQAISEKKKAVHAHINRRPHTTKEPLYRRARLAAQLREIPKVTQVDLGHIPQYALDDDIRDDFSLNSKSSMYSNQNSQSEKGLKLPVISPVRSSPTALGESMFVLEDSVETSAGVQPS